MSALVFVLGTLSAYRLTTLVTTDTITAPLRRRALRRFPARVVPLHGDDGEVVEGTGVIKAHPLVELANCPTCLGVWLSGAVFALAHLVGVAPSWPYVVGAWWAGAAVIGILSDVIG